MNWLDTRTTSIFVHHSDPKDFLADALAVHRHFTDQMIGENGNNDHHIQTPEIIPGVLAKRS